MTKTTLVEDFILDLKSPPRAVQDDAIPFHALSSEPSGIDSPQASLKLMLYRVQRSLWSVSPDYVLGEICR